MWRLLRADMIKKWRIFLFFYLLGCTLSFPALSSTVNKPLVMGIFPRQSAKATIKNFTPLAQYLSEKMGRPVKLETTADFDSFWKSVTTQRYDIVHYNQYHYIRSHKRLGYAVIVMNEESGTSSISSVIVTRKDSGINSLGDLKGKKIIFGGGPKAMMSYIMPTHLLRSAGLNRGDYEEDFAKSPPNAVLAGYYGQAAGVGVGDIVLQLPGVRAKSNMTEMQVLARSRPLSHLPWAVRHDMPDEAKRLIQTALVEMKHTRAGLASLKHAKLTGLNRASDSDYHEHRLLVRDVLQEDYFEQNHDKHR